MKKNSDYKPKKREELKNCPRCKRRAVKTKSVWRINWPYGRKSKPEKTLLKQIRKCTSCGWRGKK